LDSDGRCFYYRGYLLMCDPTRLRGGGYRANVVICRADKRGETLVAESLKEMVFISEWAAVVHAKDWAAHWIDENLRA
jgi:hypothetical protein